MTARKFGPFPVTAREFYPSSDDDFRILSVARDWCEEYDWVEEASDRAKLPGIDRPKLPPGHPDTIERLDGEPPLFALTWFDGQRFEVTIDFDRGAECYFVKKVGL